jgi:protein TonB
MGGLGGGDILGGLGGGSSAGAPPPPPPKAPARIKLGGQVQAAKIVAQPQPLYPALARQARIQGNVVLHAIIDKDGRVGQLEVVSGHPLLVQAALDAVKQWRYQPTQLNGDPVEVDTTITVSFVLGG